MYFAVRMTEKLRYYWHEMILVQSTKPAELATDNGADV